jgi:ABC-2 type transport system permease protein
MTPQTFLTVVLTDLKLFFTDRRAVLLTLLVPIGIASFFGLIFSGGGGSGKTGKVDLALFDGDRSPITKKVIERLKADGSFRVAELSEAEAHRRVREGKAPVAILFPSGFAKAASDGLFVGGDEASKPRLTLVHDPSKSAERQMLRGLLMQHVSQVVMQDGFTNQSPEQLDGRIQMLEMSTMPEGQKKALSGLMRNLKDFQQSGGGAAGDGPGGFSMPFTIADEASVSSKSAEKTASATHIFVGMGVQGLLFFTIDFAIGLLRERRAGLLRRVRTAPVARTAFLLARLVAATLISLACLGAIFCFGALTFQIRIQGSVAGFAIMALASALMTASFGLAVAALGKTEQQARAAAVPCVLGMSILGGAWFPAMFFPAWLQTLSQVFPTRWAVEGFDNVTWRSLGLASIGLPAGIVLAFAALFAGFALLRFRWE